MCDPYSHLMGLVSMCLEQGTVPPTVSFSRFQTQIRFSLSWNLLRAPFCGFSSAEELQAAAQSQAVQISCSQVFACGESRLESSAEDFCSFFSSVVLSCWGRKCLGITQMRRWERILARVVSVSLLSEDWWESAIIVLRNVAFTDRDEVIFRGS